MTSPKRRITLIMVKEWFSEFCNSHIRKNDDKRSEGEKIHDIVLSDRRLKVCKILEANDMLRV